MATVINTASIEAFLKDGLFKVRLEIQNYPAQFKEIYVTEKSSRSTEFIQEAYGPGPAGERTEGSAAGSGSFGTTFAYSFTHKFYAISGTFTQQAVLFNRYREYFPRVGEALRNSLLDTKNKKAMDIFNNAFNPAFVYADGKQLCALDHPNVYGTYANTLSVAADPSERSLNDIKSLISRNVAPGGTREFLRADRILTPIELENQFVVLLGSEGRPGTANRETNPIKETRFIPKGYMVNSFLESPMNWFVQTSYERAFMHFVATEPTPNVDTDPLTNNSLFVMSEGYSFGPSSPRGVFGVQGLGVN